MKQKLLSFMRRKEFQSIWEKAFHVSKIGMNYWGGASLYHSGEIYALKYANKILKRSEKKIIFDVGANYGQFAILSHEVFKNAIIYSFEPSKFAFEELIKNISNVQLNNFVITKNFGFGSKNEHVKLYSSGKGAGTASVYDLKTSLFKIRDEYSEVIELKTIDEFSTENEINNIDYLKIDVEGHELQVLKGAQRMIERKKIRFIQFEFGEFHIDSKTFFRDFYDYLSPFYKINRIVSNGIRPIDNYSTNLEVFSTSNFLAELKQ